MRTREVEIEVGAAKNGGLPRGEVILHLARAAEREGLGLCLWRHGSVAPELAGSDVDSVIGPHPWPTVRRFFERELEQVGWCALRFVARGNMLICLFARQGARPAVAEDFVKLDLNCAFSVGGLPFASFSEILARSRVEDGVRRLDPVDAVVASYLVKYLDQGVVKPAYAEAYWAALDSHAERVRSMVADAVGGGRLAHRLLTPGRAWPGARVLRWARLRAALARRPRETLRIFLRKLGDFVPTLRRPSGRMLVVCGPDGAGKSTMTSVLEKLVDEKIFTHVRSFHTRPFMIPRLAKIVPMSEERRRALLEPPPRREVDPELRDARSSLFTSSMRLAIATIDFALGYWLKVRPRLMRGELIIFDRYTQDYIVDANKRGISFPPAVFRWLSRVVPSGDLHVYLVAKPETLVARKGELLPLQAVEQVERYASLAVEDPRGLLLNSEHLRPPELAGLIAERLLADRG
jgi:thymidylate kinase